MLTLSWLHLQWIVLAIFAGILLIVDLMFLSEDTFVYDPVSPPHPTSPPHLPLLHPRQPRSVTHLLSLCVWSSELQVVGYQDRGVVLTRHIMRRHR